MLPARRHRWRITPSAAIALQKRLAGRIRLCGGPRDPKLIAGADVAYDPRTRRCFAAVVVVRSPSMEVVEYATAMRRTAFPYVPGLLTFREGPVLLDAFARLRNFPDLILFDGQGIAHPRRFGLAAHLGYLLDIASVGCAKSRLIGQFGKLRERAGSFAWLVDRDERIGAALRTRDRVRPIFVSPGYRVGLRNAIALAFAAATKHRVPEPTRLADLAVAKLKRERLSAATARAIRRW
ncbi:MAG: deoxyribonuclease V [Candidatus Binataceae bacterium]